MQRSEISKEHLYEGVKTLVTSDSPHIHLPQHKLYTLFSIAFQYMLFSSTKKPGHYIIRLEDSYLLDKVLRKAKDISTKKFIEKLALTRRLKYGNSTFYLDYFQMATWGQTNDLPKDKIQAAVIVRNASPTPFADSAYQQEVKELRDEGMQIGDHHYLSTLQEFVPRTISIAYETELPNVSIIEFPFIKRDEERTLSGVKISDDLSFGEDA